MSPGARGPQAGVSAAESAERASVPKRTGCAVLSVLLAAVLTAAVVQASFHQGRLAQYPTFDDVTHFHDAARRLRILQHEGLGAAAADYLHHPAHAPYNVGLALLAFALLGLHDWAPYTANGLLALCWMVCAGAYLRGLRRWELACCLVFVATVPLVGLAVHEFRADPAHALVTAVGSLMAASRPLTRASPKRWAQIGLVFGLALLVKPSAFALTLIMLAGSLGMGVLADMRSTSPPPLRRAIVAGATAAAVCFTVAAPHFVLVGASIWRYFWVNIFGSASEIWVVEGSTSMHVRYYFDGYGGRATLGNHLWLLAAVLVPACLGAVLWRRRRGRVMAVLGVVVLAFAVAVLNKTKDIPYGMLFHTLLVLVALMAVRTAIIALRNRRPLRVRPVCTAIPCALCVTGLALFRFPVFYGHAGTPRVEDRRRAVEWTYRQVKEAAPPKADVLLASVGALSASGLSLLALKDNADIRFHSNVFAATLEEACAGAERADLVVVADRGSGIVIEKLPVSGVQDELVAWLSNEPGWECAATLPLAGAGKSLHIFRRRDPDP